MKRPCDRSRAIRAIRAIRATCAELLLLAACAQGRSIPQCSVKSQGSAVWGRGPPFPCADSASTCRLAGPGRVAGNWPGQPEARCTPRLGQMSEVHRRSLARS